MATKSFYPNLSTIVTVDAFPEELQFLENGLQDALDNIYFKELQYDREEMLSLITQAIQQTLANL